MPDYHLGGRGSPAGFVGAEQGRRRSGQRSISR